VHLSAVQLTQGIQYAAFTLVFGGMLFLSRTNRSLAFIFLGYLLGSLGLIIGLGRNHEPAWLSNVAGLEIPQLRYGLLHAALVSFVGRFRATQWVAVVMAVVCLPFYVAWSGTGYADPAFADRNFAVLAVALAVQTALSAWLLLCSDETATRLPRYAMSTFLFLYCLSELGRLFVTFAHETAAASTIDSLSTAFYLVVSSGTPVAFIWLLNARLLDELERQTLLDPLTRLLNRRGLQRVSERELPRHQRTGRDFALAVADIDHFKRLNDTHGHVAGDAVLREIGALLEELVRRSDAVARIGGEEFVILLAETDPANALTLVDRLRASIAERGFAIGDTTTRVTASFGVTTSRGRTERSLETLIDEADAALYDAKQAGRNRCRVYDMRNVASV